jgi:ribonuclease BN (tRNA processing enzyme)
MRVVILGSGGPIPDGRRVGASHLVETSVGPILFDTGTSAGFRLAQAKVPFRDIDHIFLSHLHMDHCIDMPSIIFSAFLTGRTQPVNVYGPKGLVHLGQSFFDDLFPYLKGIIKSVTRNELSVTYHEIVEGRTDIGKVAVHAGTVSHGNITSFGFRIEDSGKIVTYSGDTEPCDGIIKLAQGADLLIHDCAFPDSAGPSPGHTIPSQLRSIASRSGCKHVVLSHLFPPCNGHEEEMVQSVKAGFGGAVSVAEDLKIFQV